ncbi:MAG: sigma-E factor negative regulatory protein [Pseudomonadota bacterium]
MDKEKISSFVDGEFDHSQAGAVIDALNDDPALQATWKRYHLIGEALRAQDDNFDVFGVSEKIQVDLNNEPTLLAPRAKPAKVSVPWSGLAIAASVAVVTVAVFLQGGPESEGPQNAVLDNPPPVVAEPAPLVAQRSEIQYPEQTASLSISPNTQKRLEGYMVNFNERRSTMGVRGMPPHVRTVGFENK